LLSTFSSHCFGEKSLLTADSVFSLVKIVGNVVEGLELQDPTLKEKMDEI
jgi:hypothetical protein